MNDDFKNAALAFVNTINEQLGTDNATRLLQYIEPQIVKNSKKIRKLFEPQTQPLIENFLASKNELQAITRGKKIYDAIAKT